MWQSQHCFGTVVPWQAPEFGFPALSMPRVCPQTLLCCLICSSSSNNCLCYSFCGQTHAAFSPTSEALLVALMESSPSQHTLPSSCLVWKSGIPHAAIDLLTTSRGEGGGWLPLCPSKATLRVVARAKAPLEPCIPPTTSEGHCTWASSEWATAMCSMGTSKVVSPHLTSALVFTLHHNLFPCYSV